MAAVSVGIVNGQPLLDLCYAEDVAAAVDMNLVMNSAGEFIELQGSGEEATFTEAATGGFARARQGGHPRIAGRAGGSTGSGLIFPWANPPRRFPGERASRRRPRGCCWFATPKLNRVTTRYLAGGLT